MRHQHPSLAPLKPLYEQRHLAIVDAVGSPDPTRSHFDAQDYMESGTPGRKATQRARTTRNRFRRDITQRRRQVERTLKRNRTQVEKSVRKAQSTVQERVSTLV